MRIKNLEFIGLPEHEILENGIVRSLNRVITTKSGNRVLIGKELSTKVGNQGYPHITINYKGIYKGFSLHRLLALSFIPNPNNYPAVNHIDGDKTNYTLDNLEWCTHVKNIRHAYANGLSNVKRGVYNKNSILNPEKVELILNLVKNTELSYKEIGKKFDVSGSCIGDIIKGKVWNNNKFSIKELEDFINFNKIFNTNDLVTKLKETYE